MQMNWALVFNLDEDINLKEMPNSTPKMTRTAPLSQECNQRHSSESYDTQMSVSGAPSEGARKGEFDSTGYL